MICAQYSTSCGSNLRLTYMASDKRFLPTGYTAKSSPFRKSLTSENFYGRRALFFEKNVFQRPPAGPRVTPQPTRTHHKRAEPTQTDPNAPTNPTDTDLRVVFLI